MSTWPFDGPLPPPAADNRVTVAEIYPRLAYCMALDGALRGSKRHEATREEAIVRLRDSDWVRHLGVRLADTDNAIRSDDAVDALLAAAALLRCLLEGRPLADPRRDDAVAEGGIFLSDRPRCA